MREGLRPDEILVPALVDGRNGRALVISGHSLHGMRSDRSREGTAVLVDCAQSSQTL